MKNVNSRILMLKVFAKLKPTIFLRMNLRCFSLVLWQSCFLKLLFFDAINEAVGPVQMFLLCSTILFLILLYSNVQCAFKWWRVIFCEWHATYQDTSLRTSNCDGAVLEIYSRDQTNSRQIPVNPAGFMA